MKDKNQWIREAFRDPLRFPVKITPDGFEIDGDSVEELVGRVATLGLSRKLFEESVLVCSSSDGITGTGGRICDQCLHPQCQPRLRIQLVSGKKTCLLELASSSARNLFAMEDELAMESAKLWDCLLKLTVINRGYWGEVCFEKIPDSNKKDGVKAS